MDLRKLWLVLALLAGAAQAQFIGYTSLQTTANTGFTNQCANASSAAFNNIGQSAHFLTVCPQGNFNGTVSLEASNDGTFANPAVLVQSSPGAIAQCRIVQAGGYYNAVRARLLGCTTGSVSVFYTGIAGPIPYASQAINTTGPSSPPQCDTGASANVATATSNVAIFSPPFMANNIPHTYVCQITVSFNGATTAGTITLFAGTSGTCTTNTGVVDTITITANTPQTFQVQFPNGFQLNPAGTALCVTTGAITATATISASITDF